jgi:uncharacterized protein (TIGR03000 family)
MSLLRLLVPATLAVGATLALAAPGHAQRGGRGGHAGGGHAGGGFRGGAPAVRPNVAVHPRPVVVHTGPVVVRPVRVVVVSRRVRFGTRGFFPLGGAFAFPVSNWWNFPVAYQTAPGEYGPNDYYYYSPLDGSYQPPPAYMPPADGSETPDVMPPADPAPPAEEPAAAAPATVEVQVLDPQAALWFNGRRMSETGRVRTFRTPPLEPGHDYSYDVTATYYQGGRLVTSHRTVIVNAGGTTVVSFVGRAPAGDRSEAGTTP